MSACLTVTGFTKQNALPLALGIALGVLGAFVVRWFRSQEAAVGTFQIIHLQKGGKVAVQAVSLQEFKKVVTVAKLNALRASVNWGQRTERIWQDVFKTSAHIVCAIKDRELIAYGCLVGNRRMGLMTDIHVHPDHQLQKIGSHVMNNLVKHIKSGDYASVGLFGWKENQTVLDFYKRSGFKIHQYAMESSGADLIVQADLVNYQQG